MTIARRIGTPTDMAKVSFGSALIFLVPPASAIAVAAPAAWFLPYWPVDAVYIATVSPFYLAIAAAPGYVAAWYRGANKLGCTAGQRLWYRASLITSILCSLTGIAFSALMIWFLLPSLLSLVTSTVLLVRFERPPSRAPADSATSSPSST